MTTSLVPRAYQAAGDGMITTTPRPAIRGRHRAPTCRQRAARRAARIAAACALVALYPAYWAYSCAAHAAV